MSAKILLVDDDHEQAILYTQVLEASGYAVAFVENAEDAQARLSVEPFDLLLADWDLGPHRMQGDALIAWAKEYVPQIKTILFSNHMEVDEVAAACGADAAFRKVEGIVPLRNVVSRLLAANSDHA
ncbi:MAG TPA: response regulator [Armatimonadota bacterium]|nr:response regulator [Armatimonadota bacterium]